MLNLEIYSVLGLESIPTLGKGNKIHIKKENRGKFTKSAKAAGESVLEHAAKVLKDPNATPLQKKRANFARNAAKWKHQQGGTLKLTPEEEQYLTWSKLSPKLKRLRNTNIAKSFINRGPSVSNCWNAIKAYFGGFNPTNPHLNTGEAPNPGMRNPKQVVGIVLKAKSITERAAKISDKIWDKHYLRLLNKGETKRLLSVRDLHFRAKAPGTKISSESGKPIHAYHGTGKQFTEFDTTGKYSTLDNGYWGKGAYFSPNKEVGEMYAQGEKTPVVYDTYLNIKNPEIRIMDSEKWLGTPIKNGDGVIAKLPEDLVDETFDMTEFVATKPSLIKLSNAVTRDNNGKIIPISQRDNFLINDIRYKKGGKTHKPSQRPWGHRSILDNGWQSTKLLKDKKNVYGKSK